MFTDTLSLIIKRTLPLTVGVFAILMVQLVDSVFISQLGVSELTVQGITQPFSMILIGFQVGLGIAMTSIISRALGAGNDHKAKSVSTISVLFGMLLISLICVALWLFRASIFSVFINDADNIDYLKMIFSQYWPIWLFSSAAGGAMYFISTIFRAYGDTKTPGLILVVSSLINLVLDPLLIFTLDFGIQGAAIASAVAFLLCFIYMLMKIIPKGWLSHTLLNQAQLSYVWELICIAAPSSVNQLLPSLSAFLTMLLVSTMGNEAIALWSLLARVETFVLVLALSLTMSLPPMVGRYFGEGNSEKTYAVAVTAAKLLLVVYIVIAVIIAMLSGVISGLVAQEPALASNMTFALWILPVSYGPLGLCMVVTSLFNAFGLPGKAMQVSCIRLFIFYVPAIFLGAHTGHLVYTMAAASVANILAGLSAWLLLSNYMKVQFVPVATHSQA